ncbi:MAG: DNA internalization-related competence protein ComEC/Rec2 [Legionellaceae bacterium]|nr:DNA internalization-related competence protein ComEC/Rec2 [Legionellaceae bacterium]
MEILCFLAGMIFVYAKSLFPWFFLLAAYLFRPTWILIVSFLVGVAWAEYHQHQVSAHGMPNQSLVQHADISGFIASIPIITNGKTQFQFTLNRLNRKPVQAAILLSCYQDCPNFKLGQYWDLKAKLHKGRNLANPGGFDFVSWLKTRHIQWVGVTKRASFQLDTRKNRSFYLLSLRQHMADRLAELDSNEKTLGIIQALALGMTTHIDKAEWDLFRRTGTTHLMVISGAHIGLIAGIGFAFAKWLWCRTERMCLYIPAQRIASIVALMMALIYALLAGFAVPAQRSFISCGFMLLRYFLNQRFSMWQAWRYALLIVLIFEAHAVLMPGFYLSFMAVAILIVMNQRLHVEGVRKTLCMQLACLLGLMPLTLFWFSYGAINGFFANLIAIPWVGFVIVPLSLITTLIGQWFSIPWIVWALRQATLLLLYFLQWIDSFAGINLTTTYSQIISPLALIIAMCVGLLMPLRQYRIIIILLLIVGVFPRHEQINLGEARIDILDVGQGLAVVIRTAAHRMIYDTGMQFYQGNDMGKMVIIPYLSTLGIRQLDKVVISHPDLDHRGGLKSLMEKYVVKELIVDNPKVYKHARSCHDYPDWTWEGISFHFFPIKTGQNSKNNTSCVLQIKNKTSELLLTGDIEKPAETYLADTYSQQLKSEVIVVPHHGSKTSSTLSFLSHVAPHYAIVSYGFDNRYHFPHRSVIEIYKRKNILVYNTVDCGMVTVMMKSKGHINKPSCYRKQ